MSTPIAPKLVAEFIGTFALIFIGAGAGAVVGDGVGLPGLAAIAFAHGLTVMVFAFAYGSVSGGHFNPSVTVGVLAAGAMRIGEAAGYIVSQLIGGIVGAFLSRAVLGGAETGLGTPASRAQPRFGCHHHHGHCLGRLRDRGGPRLFPGHCRA